MAELTTEQLSALRDAPDYQEGDITTDSLGNSYKTINGEAVLYRAAEVEEDADFGRPTLKIEPKKEDVKVSWNGKIQRDLRVRLEVPKSYLSGLGGGPAGGPNGRPLAATKGIIFPYTPTVSSNNQAVYNSVSPTHSNYSSNFFKNSSVGPISVSGKFTAQNEYEGAVILGVQHLLRTLTKMRWGSDTNAGAPPPVCRFFAYGNGMFDNVPVVVTSWKMEYPDSVDYIQVGAGIKDYGNSFVPSVCTISIDLAVQYSRTEQLNYNVTDFLNGKLVGKGYL
jgi:hypothetical protein